MQLSSDVHLHAFSSNHGLVVAECTCFNSFTHFLMF